MVIVSVLPDDKKEIKSQLEKLKDQLDLIIQNNDPNEDDAAAVVRDFESLTQEMITKKPRAKSIKNYIEDIEKFFMKTIDTVQPIANIVKSIIKLIAL